VVSSSLSPISDYHIAGQDEFFDVKNEAADPSSFLHRVKKADSYIHHNVLRYYAPVLKIPFISID
jgi:hypothetical protein